MWLKFGGKWLACLIQQLVQVKLAARLGLEMVIDFHQNRIEHSESHHGIGANGPCATMQLSSQRLAQRHRHKQDLPVAIDEQQWWAISGSAERALHVVRRSHFLAIDLQNDIPYLQSGQRGRPSRIH